MNVFEYRLKVDEMLKTTEFRSVFSAIRNQCPLLQAKKIKVLVILHKGETWENAARYADLTPLLMQAWLSEPDFRFCLETYAPQHSGKLEAMTFITKEQQQYGLGDLIRRNLMYLEDKGAWMIEQGHPEFTAHGNTSVDFKQIDKKKVPVYKFDGAVVSSTKELIKAQAELSGTLFTDPDDDLKDVREIILREATRE